MKEPQARQEAIKNAADELAHYLWAYESGLQTLDQWRRIEFDLLSATEERLHELWQQATQERRLDQQAEEKGMRH